MTFRAYIALGANLGDRLATLRSAVRSLGEIGPIIARSSVWETEAVGPPPDYYNAVVALDATGSPHELLAALLDIETAHGRLRSLSLGRDAPRTLDLDLLLFEDRLVRDATMEVPHPRMHERSFVLEPLAEIAPRLMHPVLRRSMQELLASLPRSRRVRRIRETI